MSTYEIKRRYLIISLVVMMTSLLSLSAFMLIFNEYNEYETAVFYENEKQVTVASTIISVYLKRFESDMKLISDILVEEINHSMETDDDRYNRLGELLNVSLLRNEFAYQMRIINTDGFEILRYEKTNSGVSRLPDKLLQDKSDRYYFIEGMKKDFNELYYSPMDLNIEKGEVEIPYKPTIRMTKKIIDKTGAMNGLLVINFDTKLIFSQINLFTQDTNQTVEVINADGYWLNHEETEKTWGFMFEDKMMYKISNMDDELWELLQNNPTGNYALENRWVTVDSFESEDQNLYLVIEIPHNRFRSDKSKTLTLIIFIHIIIFLLLLAILSISIRFMNTRQRAREALEKQAFIDTLTGIPNRQSFDKELSKRINLKNINHKFALLFIDLDGFKNVNDEFGHKVGDQVLIDVAQRLIRCLRDSDYVFRLGGDEFTIIADRIKIKEDVKIIAKKILDSISNPFVYGEIRASIGASIGIAVFPEDGTSESTLLTLADQLMYEVKKSGKNNYYYEKRH